MKKIPYIEDMHEWEQSFSFCYETKVRFSETDMFGHMNNTVPFIYFEAARIDYFQSIGFMQEWTKPKSDTIPVVANLQCDYLHQVYFEDLLRIFVKAVVIGNSSVDLHYMGKKMDGTTCFTGRGTIVQISKKTGKGVPWTDERKKLFTTTRNNFVDSVTS